MELTNDLSNFLLYLQEYDLTHMLDCEVYTVTSVDGKSVYFDKPFNILGVDGWAINDNNLYRVSDTGSHPNEVLSDKTIPVGEKVRIVFFEYFRQGKGIPLIQRGRPRAIQVGQILTRKTKDGQWGGYWPDEIEQGV